jgi:hypothetical protein
MRFSFVKTGFCFLLLLAAGAGSLLAIAVPQQSGATHAFPVMRELTGKKLGGGEFLQDIDDHVLRIRISYDLGQGRRIEEKAAFEQGSELIQKESSWRELRGDALQREYTVDFASGKATARKQEKEGPKTSSGKVEIARSQTFAGFGFVLALQNLRDRLVKGETIELKAVGFTPKPRVVSVKLSYEGTDRTRMSNRLLRGEHFMIKPEIPAIAKLFIKISDTNIWLTSPPSGFLRWEGPLAEPSDPVVRVDLASGDESGPARPVSER